MISIKGREASAIALMCFYLEKSDPSIMKIIKREFEDDYEKIFRTEFEFNGSIHVICRSQFGNADRMDEVIIE